MATSPTRSAQSSDDNDDTAPPPSLLSTLLAFLAPFLTPVHRVLDFLSSPSFLRFTISALVFLLLSSLLLTLSTTAYLVFYYNYIPPISLSIPLYLQYGVPHTAPYALAEIGSGTLVAAQAYEVSVELEVPRSPTNLENGVFMVDVRFLGGWDPLGEVPESLRELLGNMTSAVVGREEAKYSVLRHARRPAMLRYRSWGLEKLWKGMGLPGHLLGWRDLDAERVRVVLWEGVVFKRGVGGLPGKVRVEVASGAAVTGLGVGGREEERQVQVYKAGLEFRARFSGLRYLVYNHRIVSFVVFSAVFYVVSIVSLGLVWAWIGPTIMAPDSSKAVVKREPPSRPVKADSKAAAIKTEDEDEDGAQGLKLEDLSDSPAQFPSGRGRPPLRYDGRPGEDDGAGPAEVERAVAEGERADDEEEDDGAGYDSARARTTGRFEGDSGIGTMSESARGGHELTRRRSGRGLGGKQ